MDMDMEIKKITKFTTILLLILKECRLERNIHQAVIADGMGKSANAFTKIETGSTALQMDTFLSYCKSLNVSPSAVMATAERYVVLFSSLGWYISGSSEAINEDGDALLRYSQNYYASDLSKNRSIQDPWILNGPIYQLDQSGKTIVNGAKVFLSALYPQPSPLSGKPPPPVLSSGTSTGYL